MKRFFLCAAALFALAACASSPEDAAPIEIGGGDGVEVVAGPSDCFTVQSVSGFTIVDDDTIRIDVGASASYEIDAAGAMCSNLSFANQIAIEPGATSGSICVGDGALAGSIRTDQGDQCQIQDVRRVPEPGAATLTPLTQ